MASAKTKIGLQVFVSILDESFLTKRKVAKDFKEKMRIRFDEYLPQWNYIAVSVTRINLQVV